MLRKIISVYSIIMGLSMLAMWTMLFVTGQIPELVTEPARIILHMLAEYMTAIGLIVAGYGLLTWRKWGYDIYLLVTGALIYTLIQSPGYYLQLGEIEFVIMFGIFMLLTLALLITTFWKKSSLAVGKTI